MPVRLPGNRIRKDSGGAWTEYIYFGSQVLAEKSSDGSWSDYIFANGVRIANASSVNALTPASSTTYYHGDQIGSTRMVTDGGGNVTSTNEFYPYGQGPQPTASNHYLFSGKERDAESGGLDYFGARFYLSGIGRFMSADWSAQAQPVPYAKLDDPQTLNLYAYVRNNPISLVDPDGHWAAMNEWSYFSLFYPTPEFACNMGATERKKDQNSRNEAHQLRGAAFNAAQQQNGSSNRTGFWSHVGNLLHLHSWNYGMRPSVTHTFDFHPLITAGTDAAGVIAPFAGRAENALGVASSIISVANDHSPKNLVMTGLPFFVRKLGLPLAIAGAAEDTAEAGSEFITDQVLAPIFNAAPPQTIDDGNGHSMPNPGLMNECQALGGNGC